MTQRTRQLDQNLRSTSFTALSYLLIAFALAAPGPVIAANCNKNPSHPSCQSDDGSARVFEAMLSAGLVGNVYTRPESYSGDPKNLVFNGNGGNVINFTLDKSFLAAHFGLDSDKCFPDQDYSGSLQLYDYTGNRNETDLVARFWFHARSLDTPPKSTQYVIDFYDNEEGWVDGQGQSAAFPPGAIGEMIYRSAHRWKSRVTSKRIKNACTSGGVVTASSDVIEVALQEVALCEYPYDDIDCS